MGPGEGDSAVSGKESGPSTTAQRIGEKLLGTFIFAVPLATVSAGSFVPVSCSIFFCGDSVCQGQETRLGLDLQGHSFSPGSPHLFGE